MVAHATCLALVTLVVSALGVAPALGFGTPISGRKLVLKTEPVTEQRRFLFKTVRDPAIAPEADLTDTGATLFVAGLSCDDPPCTPDFLSDEMYLPPEGWRALGSPAGSRGYRYRDRDGTAGGVRVVVYKPGKLVIKAVGPAWQWMPAGSHDEVVVFFSAGTEEESLCAQLGLGVELRNEPGHLSFRNAPPPAACQFSCGNSLVEPWEEGCDRGNPGPPCFSDCSFCCVGVACTLDPCCVTDDTGFVPLDMPCGPCRELGDPCERTQFWELECCDGLTCAPHELSTLGVAGSCCNPPGSACNSDADCCGAGGTLACADNQCCVKTGEVCEAEGILGAGSCCSPEDTCSPTAEFPDQARWCCTTSGGACTSGDTCCSGTCTDDACQ